VQSLQGPLCQWMMSGNDCWNKKRSNRRQKVDSEFVTTTSVGSVLQMCGAATAKARLPTVDSLTGGTTRRLALVERSVRRPGKSSTRLLSVLFLLLLAITILLTLTTFNSTTTLPQVTIEH